MIPSVSVCNINFVMCLLSQSVEKFPVFFVVYFSSMLLCIYDVFQIFLFSFFTSPDIESRMNVDGMNMKNK